MKSPAWPGLEVTISVDGDDLKEFEHASVKTDDDNHVVAFVETMSDKSFAVNVRCAEEFQYFQSRMGGIIVIDGTKVESRVLPPGFRKWECSYSAYNDSEGSGKKQYFHFRSLRTSERKNAPWTFDGISNLGSITVKILRVLAAENSYVSPTKKSLTTLIADSEIPIKALKGRAMSIATGLGPAERGDTQYTTPVTYPWGKEPFVTFTFLHRTRDDLKIEGIIPRTPSPVPLEERELSTLSQEEMVERLRRSEQQNKKFEALVTEYKKEKAAGEKIKREVGHQPSSTILIDDDEEEEDEEDDDEVTVVQGPSRPRKRKADTIDVTEEADTLFVR